MNHHCDLCGLNIEPDCAETKCSGCPLQPNCQHVTCPRCGSIILPEAFLIRWLRQIGERWQSSTAKGSK